MTREKDASDASVQRAFVRYIQSQFITLNEMYTFLQAVSLEGMNVFPELVPVALHGARKLETIKWNENIFISLDN